MACCKYCSCCCKRRSRLCCNCNCCSCCCNCNCPPPEIPNVPCLPQLPCFQPMPCLPPPPPSYQVIRERVVLPCPYPYPVPVYSQCCPPNAPRNDCYHSDVDYWNPPCQCRWPFPKYIHCPAEPLVPGYAGHVPGLKYYGAARTFGDATRDTKCIMSQWDQNCRRLPWGVFER